MLHWRSLWLALLLALVPSGLQAQSQVEFAVSGFGGVFIPTADLVAVVADDPDGGSLALEFGQATGFNAGLRFAVWPHNRVGIEAEVAYIGSNVEGNVLVVGSGGGLETIDANIDANMFVASLNVLYALIKPPLEPFSFFISGGVGLVSRGGDFWDPFDQDPFSDPTDFAGVLGLGGRYGVAPGIYVRADVRDYISSFAFTDLFGESELQNDLLASVALELTFPRR